MPTTYTPLLRVALPQTGELSGSWGNIVNANITAILEQGIAGYVTVAVPDSNYTLVASNGVPDEARSMSLLFTGTLTASRDIIVPAFSKLYFVKNTTTHSLTIKTFSGSGVIVTPNRATVLICDGVNVIHGINSLPGVVDFDDISASTYTGLGVTQSNLDNTAGRLMKVGDFGLGGAEIDIPNYTATTVNFARFGRALAGATGGPGVAGSVLIMPYDSTPSMGMLSIGNGTAFVGWKSGAGATPTWLPIMLSGATLSAPNGSAATPSFTFINDTNSGLFSPAADQIGVSVGGAESFRVGSSGIHIGGSSIPYKFTISSTLENGTPQIGILNAVAGSVLQFGVAHSFANTLLGNFRAGGDLNLVAGNASRVIIRGVNGKVGIGADPAGTDGILHVNGNITFANPSRIGYLAETDIATISGYTIANYGLTVASNHTGFGGSGVSLAGYSGIIFSTGAAERARIDIAGRMGISRTPTGIGVLEVEGSIAAITANDNVSLVPTSNPYLRLYKSGVSEVRLILDGAGTTYLQNISSGRDYLTCSFSGTSSFAGSSALYGAGSDEGLRLVHDSSFVAFYNSGNSIRTGFLQGLAGGAVILMNETAGQATQIGAGSSVRLTVASDGRLYGSSIHNNGGSMTGTANQYIGSGTYTPSTANIANIASVTPGVCQWVRVGNVVTVSGVATITPTASGLPTQFTLSLPIASAFTLANQAGGTGNIIILGTTAVVTITAYIATGTALFTELSTSTSAALLPFSFTYVIV
jgi:hypothetical protein